MNKEAALASLGLRGDEDHATVARVYGERLAAVQERLVAAQTDDERNTHGAKLAELSEAYELVTGTGRYTNSNAAAQTVIRSGAPLKVVSGVAGSEPKGFGGSSPSGTATPAKTVPTAYSGSNVRSISSGTVTALKPVVSELAEGATAFKRDYEERAKELAEEVREDTAAALFTDAAAKEAADAKAKAAERRSRAIMQGYTGNMCSECQNFTMVRNGTCEKCDTCGATSGCS